ncbi:MAG: hypothetical protein LBP95_12915 [Deltaproteobacteria bacterium]|jgi:hypothetical protein|nr:hypothetical protein [Deltaproteobacteria bacterium]
MSQASLKRAGDYLGRHETDNIDSRDVLGGKIADAHISVETVRKTREDLGLSAEMFAALMGVNVVDVNRYERVSMPPYPQGAVSRKMALLITWMGEAKTRREMLKMVRNANDFATLSGLLQTESVAIYTRLVPGAGKGTRGGVPARGRQTLDS